MGNRYRQPPPDMVNATVNVQNRVNKLERLPRAISTSVDKGSWSYVAPNGVTIIEIGENIPETGVPGWVLRRWFNGTPAMILSGAEGEGEQVFELRDNVGYALVSDDPAGEGLGTPFIPYTAVKTSELAAPLQSTTSATFNSKYTIKGMQQHPVVMPMTLVYADAGTVGEYRFLDTNTNIVQGGPYTIVDGIFEYELQIFVCTGGWMQPVSLDLQVRRVSGAGNVGVALLYCYGRGQ